MPSAVQAELYRNPSLPAAGRVKDLLSRMTLEEKAAHAYHGHGDPLANLMQ